MDEYKDFFISYNKADRQWAKWIASVLEKKGYFTTMQAWDFRPGDNFVLEMHKALVQSERFIAVLSEDYLTSMYCQAEWAAAFTKDPNSEKRLFIPVRVADVEPEGLFSAVIYIDLFGVDENTAEKYIINGVDLQKIPRNRPAFPGIAKTRFPGSLPFNNLPYIRNRFFTGRDSVLEGINDEFESGDVISLTQAITGFGGVGKTQIALEYAYRYMSKYNLIWWVSAETEAMVLKSYEEFAKKMVLLNADQQDSQLIIETVLNWMDSHDKWLFIYDNVDTISDSSYWWPRNNREHILITTRDMHIQIGKRVNITVFTKEEGISFLERCTEITNDREEAFQLTSRLGYLPLAIEQAAVYIKNNGITYEGYLMLLKEYGLKVLEEVEEMHGYVHPVTVTWEISMNRINQEAAHQLLYLCGYMAPDNIDTSFFDENTELLPMPLKEQMSEVLTANKVWKELTKYSLLEKKSDKKDYSMHRLLQEVVRNKLSNESKWIQICLRIFCKIYKFEYGNLVSQNQFIKWTPHVEAVADTSGVSLLGEGEQKRIADLYNIGGIGNYYMGNYNQALEWHKRALNIRETVLGKEHPCTAITYNNMASVYLEQGEYNEALGWYQRALLINEAVLGKKHRETATSYHNMGSVYSHQGEYGKALEWYRKDLSILETILDKNHPLIAGSFNDMAGVYCCQGDYSKALELFKKALSIHETVLGMNHPQTAAIYGNIAVVYERKSEYGEALEWHRKALNITEIILGKEHPQTAAIYSNIASVYHSQGDNSQALGWYQKSLGIREAVLGEEHPDTANTYSKIASVYSGQGKNSEALKWYGKALEIFNVRLGLEHLHTKTVKKNMESLKSLI